MKLTNFGSVVKTYKKNFLIRKEKFIAERKAIQEKKKKDREDLIEAQKQVAPLIKLKGSQSTKPNFLGDIRKFLGLMLAGFILQNLKTIIPLLSEAFKKIKEIVSGIGEFVSGVIGGLRSFYDASTEKIDELNKYIEDFKGIDISEFKKFETEVDKLGRGALAIAGVLSSAELIKDLLGFGKVPSGSGLGGSGATPGAAKKTPPQARIPTRARIPTATPVRTRTPVPVITPAPTPVPTPTPKPTAVPAQPRVPVGAGTGKGKPFGDLASRTGRPGDLFSDTKRRMLSDLTDKTLSSTIDDFSKIKNPDDLSKFVNKTSRQNFNKFYNALISMRESGAPPTALEEYLRQMQDQGIRASDELVGAAGDAAAVRSGALPDNELIGIVEKFDDAMAAETRLKADLRAQGIKVDDLGDKIFKEVFEDYADQLRRERTAGFLNRATTSTRTVAQRAATVKMTTKIIRFLRYLGITLGVVSLVLLAKEIEEDYRRGDMKAVIVKLSAAGFGAMASGLAYTAGIALAGTGVGFVKGALIFSGAAGIGIGLEEGIRRGFLGSSEQPSAESVKPVTAKLPPLPPTGTLGTGAQAYGAPRDGGKRRHAGVDFDPADDKNSKFYSRIGGEVIYAANAGGGYGNVVDIYNAELGVTERIAEGDRIHVKKGDIVKPGTLVQSGSSMTGVFHYEIRKGRAGHSGAFEGTLDPLKFLEKLKSNGNQASIKTSPSSLISSAGLNQSTTYSSAGMSVRREVNNIFIPVPA